MLTAARWLLLFVASGFRTLIGSNTEAREDFVAINNAIESQLQRSIAQSQAAIERCDRMQADLDAMRREVIDLRQENADLRLQLAECNRRHDEDAATITSLTQRINVLEAK